MGDDLTKSKGLSRRGFLRGMIGAAAGVGALSSGCGMLSTDIGPIAVRHPSWHDDARLRADRVDPIRLKVVSYNVAHWKGGDGKTDAQRIVDILAPLEPDVIALQETDMARVDGTDQPRLDYIAQALGHQVITVPDEDAGYCYRRNALMTRFPINEVNCIDISRPGRDKRGLLEAELMVGDEIVRVIGTHLGLDSDERARQITDLLNWLFGRPKHRGAVVMGDFNEWFGGSANFAALERYLGESRGPSTFPAEAPLFHLDRIWSNPVDGIKKVGVPRNALTKIASDHLPIWAHVEL
jgi:endonuclease/exonuclease/phosphatase family metal-dependent hydrolase